MRVFLDTEFTSLESPQLLSIGMVSEVGLECYIELDLESCIGQRRIAAASPYAIKNVLSQWSRDVPAREGSEHLGVSAASWLERLAEHLGDEIELVYADTVAADLLKAALRLSVIRWPRIEHRLQWSIVSYLNGSTVAEAAMDESWARSRVSDGLERHHALADARALQAGFRAMHGESSA